MSWFVRGIAKLGKYVPETRTVFSNSLRVGESTHHARTITRSHFFLCRSRDSSLDNTISRYTVPLSNKCGCGCNMHTKGDKELSAFLQEEIANESKSQTSRIVNEIDEFAVKYDGAEVTLTKNFQNEIITIKTNVNHSVDAEDSVSDPNDTREVETGEMKAKPDFTVEVAKGKRVLSFECSFSEISAEDGGEDAYNDSFQITEIQMFENDVSDSTYSVSGDIMDGYLYDLLMNYLDERGVTNDFADKMIGLLTTYEHTLYVELLQGMKKFLDK